MGLGLRPGAKAPDQPPMHYRLRASPRLYAAPRRLRDARHLDAGHAARVPHRAGPVRNRDAFSCGPARATDAGHAGRTAPPG